MTEPEQWAVELRQEITTILFHPDATRSDTEAAKLAALTIQRAFEERERELREAAGELLSAQDAVDNWRGVNEGTLWWRALERRRAALLATSRALTTCQDAPVTENSDDQ